eukprot:scpid80791/ scgid8501/ 
MDGGQLSIGGGAPPARGGDLRTMQRQSGGFLGFIGKMLGLGPGELQQHMADPAKSQMIMQRGGFPWALAGLSLLPTLLGKGKAGSNVESQMKTAHDPIMLRGGLTIPPALISKGLPLLKSLGIPLAMGALASVGNNVVDKVFGDGVSKSYGKTKNRSVRKPRGTRQSGRRKTSGRVKTGRRVSHGKKTRGRAAPRKRGQARKTRKGTAASLLLREAKSHIGDRLQSTGRRLFQKAKSAGRSKIKSKLASSTSRRRQHRAKGPAGTPFARKIRENLARATNTDATPISSSHIGQTFNI